MRKIALISIIFVLFISISFVSADDSLENATLTTATGGVGLSQELVVDNDLSNENVDVSGEISIDDLNYEEYFMPTTGKFKNNVDMSKINTLKIGNVSEKLFVINTPLNIMPVSSDCEMKNCVIHLVSGSDRSNITGLTINNTKGSINFENEYFKTHLSNLHGIWFTNSSYNYICNNTIRIAESAGCYAMPMGWSNNNQIINNDMITGLTCCMVMGSCHNNNISYNRMEILRCVPLVTANVIYFNPFGHADYSGPANCSGNYIFSNYLKSNSNDIWSWVLVTSGANQIINNTIFRGFYGITGTGVIKGNTLINSSTSINCGNGAIVCNNKIMGISGVPQFCGIDVGNGSIVYNNTIEYDYLEESGIFISGTNAEVFDNKIKLSTYGVGILIDCENNSVRKNTINTISEGIRVSSSDNIISSNLISSKSNGVVLSITDPSFKIYNNTISFNRILSEKYAVVLNGNVYNTQIHDNLIETNSSEIFYIDIQETFIDRDLGKIWDNSINGVIEDTDTIIVNDNNFYDYFDENGNFIHEFNITEKRRLFLSFLSNKNLHFTDQIALTSNRQPNLLNNVTITFSGDASDSSISDFKFYNFDKTSIILDGVENVEIKNNKFTTIASEIFDVYVISIVGGCSDSNIVDNEIFITSNANYSYAISISEPLSKIRKSFSDGLNINGNHIFIKSTGVSEGIYADALERSIITSNDINIVSDDSAYGIAFANVFGSPHDIKIDSNEITVYSKEMSYLIELYLSDSIQIVNNSLKGVSNGIYGIGVYNSHDITINENEIAVSCLNLTENSVFDALGKGNSAIYIDKSSQVNKIYNNTIDVDNCEILTNDSSSLINKFKINSFVIAPYNYDFYFDLENKLVNDTIKDYDAVLFKNFTTFKTIVIDFPVLIKPYKDLNQFTSYLILSGNYSNLNVSGFCFKNATVELDNVSNLNISNNSFVYSKVHVLYGVNNSISNNSFMFELREIVFDKAVNTEFAFNNLTGNISDVNLITSNSSVNNNISYNLIVINATGDIHVYNSLNTTFDSFFNNDIDVVGDYTSSVIYYGNSSSNNRVMLNNIISSSIGGSDYAVAATSIGNTISNNYLISSNGYRRGNNAVNASGNSVYENTPADLYVSANASAGGNGSWEAPFASIHEALQNAASGSTIYILPGVYNESNLVIDKNIVLTAINQEGNTYINALNDCLFEITKKGTLTVNALKLFNGFSQKGGGLFYNKGTLLINNSMLYNSSSYYDNSNPKFTVYKYNSQQYRSYDCKNLGLGGAILNQGTLLIDSCNFFDNFAHKGGAIADYGKMTVKNSLFYNNNAVHGGAILTDSKKECNIDNCNFHDNLAITTLDYCYIQKARYTTREDGYYDTLCDENCGSGGAIYSNSPLVIDNSLFEGNIAKNGAAIAYYCEIQNSYNKFQSGRVFYGVILEFGDKTLRVNNTVFTGNVARDTTCGNTTMLKRESKYYDIYYQYFNGGAISGALKSLTLENSIFENNGAFNYGGALFVQCGDSSIEGCKFYNNTAGSEGGAFDIYGNFNVVNTEIVNNSAKSGGALRYTGDRTLNYNTMMFNVTVANNRALASGGAFLLDETHFSIKNSNIYGNKAVNGETLSDKGWPKSYIDARGNWWGTVEGPDDSVRSAENIQYITWESDKINWGPVSISSPDDDNHVNGKDNGGNSFTRPIDSNTGSGVHTGSTLTSGSESHGNSHGFNFAGNLPNQGNGNGNYGGFNVNGLRFAGNTSSNSKTSFNGNAVNPNSMSKVNSSSVNDLSSVGMTANAADSSSGSQSSSEGGSEGSTKAYEIKKDVEKEIEDDLSIFNILFLLLWIFLFIGFYKKYKKIDER